MTVRLATPYDAPAIARLNRAFNTGEVSEPAEIAHRLAASQHDEYVVAAEQDGIIIGFACLRMIRSICYSDPWAELAELYVEEAARRQGTGRALVRYAECVAKQRGATYIIITTNVRNVAGQALYRSLDYQQLDHIVFQKSMR